MTTVPDIEEAMRRVADSRTVTDPARALARWQESQLPTYGVASRSRPRRRGVRAAWGAAAAVLVVGILGYAATRPGTTEGSRHTELTGPSAPGTPLAATAGMGWDVHRTADGWVLQHPAGWTVAEDPPCGGRKVLLVAMDPSSSDACGRLAGSGTDRSFSGYLAVREVEEIPETPSGTAAGPDLGPGGSVVASLRLNGTALEVTVGGGLPRPFLQRIASSLVAPRRVGQAERAAESLVSSPRSLAEALDASHATTEGFDGLLPRDLSTSFQAWDLQVSASLVEARLVETGPAVAYPRSLRICSGTEAAAGSCGGVPSGPTLGYRQIGGWAWTCSDSAGAGQIRCRHAVADGTWVAFQPTGTFTAAELEAALGSLSSDLDGAEWAMA